MNWLSLILLVAGAVALAYQAVALLAAVVHAGKSRLRYAKTPGGSTPGVSILKPVRGVDEGLKAALESHARLDYPDFEILFGVQDADDAAVPVIRQLMADRPDVEMRLVVAPTQAPNAKAGVLAALSREARHDVLVVNDADISVPPEYLRRVAAPLERAATGVVTCLYRAAAQSPAGQWEALGIATDFIPSTLVAPLVGIREFGLGSTLCFRRADLEAMGGFEAIGEFIADDYQLAKRITALGRRSSMSEVVVATTLGAPDWREVWRHQVRWARTIRVSRGGGYLGLPVTHAGVWAIVNAAAGNWPMALTLWVARVAMGVAAGFGVLRHWPALFAAPLIPLWDVWAFAVWLAGMSGRTVYWRGRRFRLDEDGRMAAEGE
ncbi:MAG: bacteriohopanetetrol glucosamine biosynthesis glycosyltransferase HpnI [Candidatus Solibacter usitatus]|nr:bacteriohopanetetrol glucosamine biosynthesis glycosyltransferase HpnI [Candidatus Solibacter usitatus]